ncbi:MAG: hypothetical protein H6922_01845 [Pseudomonadaceae bacterium]|nr:hypothetical protein [Pseudomonadaceae bacterium]
MVDRLRLSPEMKDAVAENLLPELHEFATVSGVYGGDVAEFAGSPGYRDARNRFEEVYTQMRNQCVEDRAALGRDAFEALWGKRDYRQDSRLRAIEEEALQMHVAIGMRVLSRMAREEAERRQGHEALPTGTAAPAKRADAAGFVFAFGGGRLTR